MKYTHKTEDGNKARIICEDLKSYCSYVAAVKNLYDDSELLVGFYKDDNGNLVNNVTKLTELSPWDDVAVDTPIWVSRHGEDWTWWPRHFCKYLNGKVYVWDKGMTSHTVDDASIEFSYWPFATLENPNGN